ncbi:MAG: DNA-directed RNA polymerase subunit beta', partial [Chloroflexi bacterium]|nr:DNA-directed RNA polymerase subunit beta' [Chloroflexota bacterium]
EKDGADARIEQLLAEKEDFFNRRRDDLVELAKAGDDSELMLLSEDRYYQLNETVGEVFEAMSGAEAILELIRKKDIDVEAEQLREDLNSKSTQRRRKAVKRLRVIESIRRSENRPEWMVYTVLPVLPPELRPMVQLDGGRFATSDLNDLYRRVINRNNRLKRLLDLGAPDIILRNEKRMLQEAVDALIDNGRRGRPAQSSSQHMYKSLSDLLRGKQGRFRQNLLGKRVDYSGRSVIVVGPELALDECGLPSGMALELFKPFVMQQLVMRGIASNIKSAKRIVERVDPEVWDILEDVTREHPIMLNRAPTLHRLGIQAFRIRLVHGGAIRIHPLVCFAYNADFDGDQMAVHVPLSEIAQEEARELMLSSQNLLSPADGSPVISPTKDMILGCYYLTLEPEAVADPNELRTFTGQDEALHAYESGLVQLHTPIRLRANSDEVGVGDEQPEGSLYETTVGRVIFDRILPVPMRPYGKVMDKGALKQLINDVYSDYGTAVCAQVGDQVMSTGFHWATRSGVTMALSDLTIPPDKPQILTETEELVGEISEQFEDGLLTEDERYRLHVKHWAEATQRVSAEVEECLDKRDSVYLMGASGAAKGNFDQIRQIAGMRGLMSDPGGRVIEMPVRANFREGLSVFEYFISTHGARKGLADTALRTADSGYLTRRLVDVCQDLIIAEHDCGTERSIPVRASDSQLFGKDLPERVYSRTLAAPLVDPETGEILADAGRVINLELMELIERFKFDEVHVRSVMKCEAQNGICQSCYGFDLARHEPVELCTAVGIIAAQSIGEPATQLTMRTFHTGGTFREEDITRGLPRVEELFEARPPRGQAVISDFGGVVSVKRSDDGVTHELVQQHE